MADVDTINGFGRIANQIMDALAKKRIPGTLTQLLWVVFRKTYGWNKKSDRISLSQFSKATGLDRSNVVRGLNSLIDMNMITKSPCSGGNKYGIQKDFDEWQRVSRMTPVKNDTGVSRMTLEGVSKRSQGGVKDDNKGVSVVTHTKDIKDNTKDKYKDKIPDKKKPIQRFNDWIEKNTETMRDMWREIDCAQYDQYADKKYFSKPDAARIRTEIGKMRNWITANPQKGNKKRWGQFVNNWLTGAYEKKQKGMSAPEERAYFANKDRTQTRSGFKKVGS